MGKKGYLAGPMTGYKLWNFPAFDQATQELRSSGWTIFSPAEMNRVAGFHEDDEVFSSQQLGEAMRRDFKAICEVDAIILLPGWRESKGATAELSLGRSLGIDVLEYSPEDGSVQPFDEGQQPLARTPFLKVIEQIVEMHNKKQSDYGRTGDPFSNVRASEDFGISGWVGCMVRANDKMRRIQKAAEGGVLVNEGVEDSLIDLAVYSIIGLVLFRETLDPLPTS